MLLINGKKFKISSLQCAILTFVIIGGCITLKINTDFIMLTYCALMCIIMTITEVYSFLAFLLPLAATFNAPYVWLALLIILLLRRKKLNVTTLIISIIIISQEILAHCLYGVSDFNRMIGYLITVILFVYLINDSYEDINYRQCLKSFVLGVSVLFALYMFNVYMEKGGLFVRQLILGSVRFGGTAADTFSEIAIQLNANTIAYYSITAIACILTLFRNVENRIIVKFFYSISLIECVLIGALTISRSWFLVAILCGFMYMLSCSVDPTRFLKRSIVIIGLAVIAFCLLTTNTTILDSFYLRFQGASVETAGGRTTITKQYMDVFLNNDAFFFLGAGVTDYSLVMNQAMSLHMGVIQLFCCMGILVAPVFIANLVAPIIKASKKRVRLVYWIPIIVVIIFTQTIQFLNPYMLMLPYAIGVYALRMGSEFEELH